MDIPPPHISEKTSRRRSKISADMLVTAFREAWRRFPVTVVYLLYTAVWSVVYTLFEIDFYNTPWSGKAVTALWYLGGVGVPLTLAVSLWCEYLERRSRTYLIAANILLLADTIYIMCGQSLSDVWMVGRSAIITALIVAIIFVPSSKAWAWNFANSQVVSLMTAGAFAIALSVAIGIIFGTVFALFSFDNFKLMFCVQELVAILVPSIIFLHLVPIRGQVEEMAAGFKATKFQCGTAKFFFLAITVIYMAILYVYGLKILFTWELPRGVVSWSVTGLTGAVLVTLFLLEGVRRTHPDDTLTLRATRLLPMAMIPLFVLMSVGLLYRIGQYGMTASRLYVLTFNVWCYVVFAYMIITRTRRFNGVAISFAVVFLLTSILPYVNYITLTDNMMRSQLREAFKELGFSKFPVSEQEFEKAFVKLPSSRRDDIESMMRYLDDKDDHSRLEDITEATYYGKGTTYISDYFIYADTVVIEETVGRVIGIALEAKSEFMDIPQGYDSVRYKSCHFVNRELPKENPAVMVDNVMFTLPIDSIIRLDGEKSFSPVVLHPSSGNSDTVYVARKIKVRYIKKDWSDDRKISRLELDGLIFTAK